MSRSHANSVPDSAIKKATALRGDSSDRKDPLRSGVIDGALVLSLSRKPCTPRLNMIVNTSVLRRTVTATDVPCAHKPLA